jgi:hypothetical protein
MSSLEAPTRKSHGRCGVWTIIADTMTTGHWICMGYQQVADMAGGGYHLEAWDHQPIIDAYHVELWLSQVMRSPRLAPLSCC